MEENHSFDNYFGTFPSLDSSCGASHATPCGINPAACLPDPATGGCDTPFHLAPGSPYPNGYVHDLPHNITAARADIDQGKMDQFVAQEQRSCKCPTHESMGWFDASDIPIFWRYAENYTLLDNLFEPNISWSYPSHLMMVSDWSAVCTSDVDPLSCTGAASPNSLLAAATWPANSIPWTDLTWLLHTYGVNWSYYVADGTEPDCDPAGCTAGIAAGTPSIWNPLPWFVDVQKDGELGNIKDITNFFSDVSSGNLPAVSWIVPNKNESGHPNTSTNAGSEAYVVSLVNAIESSSAWDSTAILLAWDDWGGEYDNVVPPTVDKLGFGLRVPTILISPYARKGFIDGQVMSFDAYNKFIEDNFLGGHRLDPNTDGRPDSRTTVREADPILGNLMNEFDFTQQPSALLFPTLRMPAAVTPGTTVGATGANFQPGDTVSIMLNCDAPDCAAGVTGASVTAAADGTFSVNFTVPAALPAGKEFVSAEGTAPLTYFAITTTTVK